MDGAAAHTRTGPLRQAAGHTHLHARTHARIHRRSSLAPHAVCLFDCWRVFEFVLVAARLRPQELKLRVNATEALALYRKAVRPRIHRARPCLRTVRRSTHGACNARR